MISTTGPPGTRDSQEREQPTSQRFVYILSICDVDAHITRYVCDSEAKARALFEELRAECIEECKDSIRYYNEEKMPEWIEHEQNIIKFLEKMKPGDVPPFCCNHPTIEMFPLLTLKVGT